MELKKLQDFITEAKAPTLTRKKLGWSLTYQEIGEFLKKHNGVSFKSAREFSEFIGTEFGVELEYIESPEMKKFIEQGLVAKNGRKIKIIATDSEDVKIDAEVPTATKVTALSKGKAKKLKIPQGKSESKYQDFLDTVLLNMIGGGQAKLLLTGDPGTGKCLEKDYMLDVEMSDEYIELFERYKKSI